MSATAPAGHEGLSDRIARHVATALAWRLLEGPPGTAKTLARCPATRSRPSLAHERLSGEKSSTTVSRPLPSAATRAMRRPIHSAT